mgnify:CR=1 FL=1
MGEGAWRVALPEGCDPVAVLDALRALDGVDDHQFVRLVGWYD